MTKRLIPLFLTLLCMYTYTWADELVEKPKYKDEILKIQNDIGLLNKAKGDIDNIIINQAKKVDGIHTRLQTLEADVQKNYDSFLNMASTTSNLKKQIKKINNLLNQVKNINSERDLTIKDMQTRLQKTENNIQKNYDSVENVASTTSNLKEQLKEIDRLLTQLKDIISEQNLIIKGIQTHLQKSDINIQDNNDSLSKTNTAISTVIQNANKQNQIINNTISKRTVYLLIGILFLTLVIIVILIYLSNRVFSSSNVLSKKIWKTKEALEAEAIKVDSKLVELLHTQLDLLKERPIAEESKEDVPDHSLPLQVGLEIHRMRKRIANMPENTKGIGALKNSLKRLEDQFNDNGYELVDLIGKPFVDGLTVEARFVPSDDLKPGEQIITKIIKPQINFNGVLMQMAEVEISTGD